MELDHVFVFVAPDASEARRLADSGLVESFRRRHPGQGTENACFCFDDAYLELLWVSAPHELADPAGARLGFQKRSRWQETGASPFGIALRDPGGKLPFPCWDYRPGYLPPGLAIPVALDSDDLRRPLIFRSPGTARPDCWTDGRAGARQRPGGLSTIESLRVELPSTVDPGAALEHLAGTGILTLAEGDQHRLLLCLARIGGGRPRRLSLPDFTWEES